jgi:hypothetical protein
MEQRAGVRRHRALDLGAFGHVAAHDLETRIIGHPGRERRVEQHDARDFALGAVGRGQPAARKQRPRQAPAEESPATGYDHSHASILSKNASTSASSRVWRIGGREARTRRP